MAVRVSKPEINLRDKLNKAEPPIGAHGSQLLKSKSTSETFDLVRAGRRNLIINGDMRIWQRSNGAAVSHSGVSLTFGPDRWMFEEGCGQLDAELSRSTDTPLDQGFRYSFKLSPTTVESGLDAGDFAQYMYFIEGYDAAPAQWGTINAKPCTLSFWLKTNTGGEHYVTLNSASGVDTWSTSVRSTINVWEHHVVTIPPPMTGTWNYTDGRGIEIRIGLMRTGSVTVSKSGQWFHGGGGYNGFAEAHSDWPFNTAHAAYLTGVQFEIGNQATPFEHRPYPQELALCQRYFYKSYGSPVGMFIVDSADSSKAYGFLRFPVPMRGNPQIILSDNNGNTDGKVTQHGAAHNIAASASQIQKEGFARIVKDSGNFNTSAAMPIVAGVTSANAEI